MTRLREVAHQSDLALMQLLRSSRVRRASPIGGNVSSRTVNGNVYARGSKTITRENVSVKEYHQEGSVGVVNGNGDFGGVLNHGGNDRGWPAESYSTRLAPPPRDPWSYQHQGYDETRYPHTASPRMAAQSSHHGHWKSPYPPTPRSPFQGPPPEYPGPPRSFGGAHQQWAPPNGMMAGGYGTSTGLTGDMAHMYVTPDPRAAYPSPPRSGHGHYPPEKGGYFN
ncbi:hypothetical protein FA13DRAFT_817069 [Coprinellus micaceus]|uniref:Uncharacterized protein n=1 Tax=Coprinellus micaceus TaxID=71717 RepID=A0A4Y7T279_COPMI|nr:hypothetical protein FA13DRAFT_817069 [Coprinellus micaceus]